MQFWIFQIINILTMDSLSKDESAFRQGQMLVDDEHVIGEYFAMEGGKMAERLRKEGVGLMEWEELMLARERMAIPELGGEKIRIAREESFLEGMKEEDKMYGLRKRLVDLLMGLGEEVSMSTRSSLFQAMGDQGMYPATFAKEHHQKLYDGKLLVM